MLTIPRLLVDGILFHTRAEHPLEACGLLVGPKGSSQPDEHIPMANVAASGTVFLFDVEDYLKVWDRLGRDGREPLVVWHSHPRGRTYPSSTDIQFADQHLLHLIVCAYDGVSAMAVYRIADGRVTPVPVTITG